MPIREPGQLVIGWGTSAAAEHARDRAVVPRYPGHRRCHPGDRQGGVRRIVVRGPTCSTAKVSRSSCRRPASRATSSSCSAPRRNWAGRFAPTTTARSQRAGGRHQPRSVDAAVRIGSARSSAGSSSSIGQPHEVVGVMPRLLQLSAGHRDLEGDRAGPRRHSRQQRLSNRDAERRRAVHDRPAAAGVTPEGARDAWTSANAQVLANSPGPRYDIAVTPFLDHQIGPARQAMWVLFGAVGVLLLIACANVSGLMLTRVSLRSA